MATADLSYRLLPMKTEGTEHFIERTYRESGEYQWVRETYINTREADATRIEFGVEWQAVENHGVYRRVIADNGCGMSPEDLVEFFNTFGGGGKPIGGLHENFGVGAKTSLLPWNRYGLVVISWQDGEPSMIWVECDSETGTYGLKLFEAEDPETGESSLEHVYSPFDDPEHGCDWAAVSPAWVRDHGTVLIFLGDDPQQNTVTGDPNRGETAIKGISKYLNTRIWEVPDEVEVYVDEFRYDDPSRWPASQEQAHGPKPKDGPDLRTNKRRIRGAHYFITYPVESFDQGQLANQGTVELHDGTAADWYLWNGERPAIHSYAEKNGFIAAVYRNELYDINRHVSVYRSFGVSAPSVRQRLWVILRPPKAEDERHGVYPRTDRTSLLLRGGPNAGGPLPINDWGAEFSDLMPQPIIDAIREERGKDSGTIEDEGWRERLQDRFGKRWRLPKLRVRKDGKDTVDPSQLGSGPRTDRPRVKRKKATRGGEDGGTKGDRTIGSRPGRLRAEREQVAGGIPTYRKANSGEFEHEYSLAAWQPHDPEYPQGVVLLNVDHPVLEAEIEHYQSQYPDHLAHEVGEEVIKVYGELSVAKVAHSEHLKGVVPTHVIEVDYRSEAALTAGLLGLIAEEAVLAPRIGGKLGRRRAS